MQEQHTAYVYARHRERYDEDSVKSKNTLLKNTGSIK